MAWRSASAEPIKYTRYNQAKWVYNYTLWGPPAGTSTTVLVIGSYSPTDLQKMCTSSSEIAPYTLPDGLANNETARGVSFYVCQDPRGSWAQLWPQLKHFD